MSFPAANNGCTALPVPESAQRAVPRLSEAQRGMLEAVLERSGCRSNRGCDPGELSQPRREG